MRDPVRREVLLLLGIVVAVDLVFVATYFALGIRSASDLIKAGFTALWTLITLLVVIRGLTRVRTARLDKTAGDRV